MKIFIATKNSGKIEEYRRIMQDYNIEIVTESDINIEVPDIEETGTSYEENAQLKARSAYKALGMAVLADDSGLEVKALKGEPGIYSARYESTSEKRINKILKKMENETDRSAKMVCAICYISESGEEKIVKAECEGQIALEAYRVRNFSYDPIFQIENGKTFAEIGDEGKDKISHRAKAIKKLIEEIREEINNYDK